MEIKILRITVSYILMMLFFPLGMGAQSAIDSTFNYLNQQIHENPDMAILISKEILGETDAPVDKKIKAIIIISTAYSSKRDYEKAMEYALWAMDLLPELKDNTLKIRTLNRIGAIYQELQIYEKAILYLNKALEYINLLPEGEQKSRNLGTNNLLRGFIYREQMSCEIALNYFAKGIEEYKKFPNAQGTTSNLSTTYYNQGNCLLQLGRIDEAKISFLQSMDYAEKEGAISSIAFAQKGLAEVYTLNGEYATAINLLNEALEKAEKVGDKVLNRGLYEALAINYLAIDDFDNYAYFRQKNSEVHQEITNVERKTVDDSMEKLMEVNSRKLEIVHKRTKTFRIIFSTLIFLALIFMLRFILISQKQLSSLKSKLQF